MSIRFLQVGILAAAALAATVVGAEEKRVTAKEAEAMVKKGVALVKANPDKAIVEISTNKAVWVDRELYLVVYKLDGTAVAHGTSPKMIGKNMLDLRDADGKEHIKERLETAKTKASFWQDYRTLNRENKKIEPKSMYCERANDLVVCGGIYKAV
jgi:signal transduction histidine kinase